MFSRKRVLAILALVLASARSASAQVSPPVVPADVKKYDANGDGWLTREELVRYAKAEDPKRTDEDADDVAADILTRECSTNCTRISLDAFIISLQDRRRRQEAVAQTKRTLLWRGFGISREVVDAVNPRGQKTKAPAVLSVKWDTEADDDDRRQETLLGAVQLASITFGQGVRSLGVTPGVDFDIDGSKDANETTLSFGLPATFLQVRDAEARIESYTVGATPKVITDRRFDREVYELAINGSLNSQPLAAGFIRPAPVRRDGLHLPKLMGYWVPSLQLELGRVSDAGGNTKLVPLEGKSYTRLAPRAKVTLFPNIVSEQLRLEADYTGRFDLRENWNRPYFEGRLSYDLVFKGAAELTLLYRRGRKPPQFTKLNDLLLGVGLKI